MTKLIRISLLFVFILLATFFSNSIIAQATISIQSTLKNISGEAVDDGMQSITFKLYDIIEGGSALWTEVADVEVVSGIYSHELGSVTALDPSDFGDQLYLGVTINNKELTPRTKLGYAPYAMAVNALAGSGESASFDLSGQFTVSDGMSVAGNISANGGITNSGTINSTGNITTNGKLGIGLGTNTPLLDLSIGDEETGLSGTANMIDLKVGGATSHMTILANGRVGIGTTSPETTLHVAGNSPSLGVGATQNNSWFNSGFEHLSTFNLILATPAIYTDGTIVGNTIMATNITSWSDKRIKTNFTKSNSKLDLDLLNKIEITEYEYIDKLDKGFKTQKKVIAQQVQKILPNAVNESRKLIPNVYEIAKRFEFKEGVLQVETDKIHDFVIGDKIDLKTPEKNLDNIEVTAVIDAHTFEVNTDEKPENIFVYGKRVNDFLSVDYDAIAMLNVSATQEMYRMIIDLQKANEDLIKENKALKSSATNMDDRLSTLEALIVKFENKTLSNTDTAGK